MFRLLRRAGALPFAIAAAACSPSPPTALVVSILIEAPVQRDIDQLVIEVERDGQPRFEQSYAPQQFPGTLTLTPAPGNDPSAPVVVRLRGVAANHEDPRISRQARLGFVAGKTKLLRMPLRKDCLGVRCEDPSTTCDHGTCKPADLDITTLPDFTSNEHATLPEGDAGQGGEAGQGGAGQGGDAGSSGEAGAGGDAGSGGEAGGSGQGGDAGQGGSAGQGGGGAGGQGGSSGSSGQGGASGAGASGAGQGGAGVGGAGASGAGSGGGGQGGDSGQGGAGSGGDSGASGQGGVAGSQAGAGGGGAGGGAGKGGAGSGGGGQGGSSAGGQAGQAGAAGQMVVAQEGGGRLALGDSHTCLTKTDGKLRCWGYGGGGRLGYGKWYAPIGLEETPDQQPVVPVGGAVVEVAAGEQHTCALLAGGVRCWGRNDRGQLGLGTTRIWGDDETPDTLSALPLNNPTRVVAGAGYSCAIHAAGKVRCWGKNDSGQLGLGHANDMGDDEALGAVPDVALGATAKQLAAGPTHVCALLTTNKVRCWGDNTVAQLGLQHTNTIGDDEAPSVAPVVDLAEDAKQVVAGYFHSCALLLSGKVTCWGANYQGQLGYGIAGVTIGDDETPKGYSVPLGEAAVRIAAGDYHTCALLQSGAVRCWGDGSYGSLGYGTKDLVGDNEKPTDLLPVFAAGSGLKDLWAGGYQTCAQRADGQIVCWGANTAGELGQGTFTPQIGDDEKPALEDTTPLGGSVSRLAIGSNHMCAALEGGAMRCWGAGFYGELGNGSTWIVGDDEAPLALDVSVGGTVAQVVAGFQHTCALLAGGSVRCWGPALSRALGHVPADGAGGKNLPSSAPLVDVGGAVVQLTAGFDHTCALRADGRVVCWGGNIAGQLGHASTADLSADKTPAQLGPVNLDASRKAVQIAAGSHHTCAVLEGGGVKCWGDGVKGQLGYANNDNIGDDETPATKADVQVGGKAVQVAAGDSHTCALLEGGGVKCWGYGGTGQLGLASTNSIGDTEHPSSVGLVQLGAPSIELAAGYEHTCALLEGGDLRCWGAGYRGALGHGTPEAIGDNETPGSRPPVPIGGPVAHVAAGSNHTCALLQSGSLVCWGINDLGQLGYGHTRIIGDDETPASQGPVF